jgi:hypothetical protein
MTTRSSTLVAIGFVLITLSLGLVQFNLIAGQGVFFTAAAIVWLVVAVQEGRRPDAPPFFLPLLVYAGLTLVSAAVSGSAWEGFVDSKQLLMFLMVPIVTRFTRAIARPRRWTSSSPSAPPARSTESSNSRFSARR